MASKTSEKNQHSIQRCGRPWPKGQFLKIKKWHSWIFENLFLLFGVENSYPKYEFFRYNSKFDHYSVTQFFKKLTLLFWRQKRFKIAKNLSFSDITQIFYYFLQNFRKVLSHQHLIRNSSLYPGRKLFCRSWIKITRNMSFPGLLIICPIFFHKTF